MTISIVNASVDAHDIAAQLNPLLDEGSTWDAQRGRQFLANPDNVLLLARVEDTTVGFLSAHRLQRFDNQPREVLLYEIGVDEPYRRHGVGKALIAALKDWSRQVGAGAIWVLTHRSNTAAMALYTAMGGTIESEDEQMVVLGVRSIF